MKRLVFITGAILSIVPIASASTTCVGGTLASYEALGSAGCMIGANTLYSFQVLPGIGGATTFDPTTLTITPLGGNTDPGLMVAANVTASGGQIYDSLINYQIAGNLYTSDTIKLSGTSTTNDGAATDIQNYCGNGKFGPDGVSGCTGTTGSLLVLGNGSNQATFLTPLASLAITHDFTLDPGLSGTTTGGVITDQFAAGSVGPSVPEPATYVLTGLGLALAAFRKIRGLSNSKLN